MGNIIEDILAIICVIGIALIICLFFYGLYDLFFIKDEVICLGGHYEIRYNHNLKVSMKHFVCDSAKIIYK